MAEFRIDRLRFNWKGVRAIIPSISAKMMLYNMAVEFM